MAENVVNLMLASVDLLLSDSSDDISEKSSSDIKAATVSYRYMFKINLSKAAYTTSRINIMPHSLVDSYLG